MFFTTLKEYSHVGSLGLNSRHLSLRFGRLFNFCHLLTLNRGRGDFHTQDDISNFTGGQGSDIDTVSFTEIAENEVLQGDFNLHPFIVTKRGPNVMRFRDRVLVGPQDDLCLFVIDVQRSEEQDQSRKGGVGRDRLEPVVVQAEQDHLGLSCSKNEITKLLHLHGSLERQLQFTTLDDDVGEIEQMDLEGVKHTLSGNNDLLRLFFHR